MNRKNIIIIILSSLVFLVALLGFTFKNVIDDYFNDTSQIDKENTETYEDVNENNTNQDKIDKENDSKEETDEKIKAPNFTLENLDGEEVSLSDYEGKVVFINFWATWCPYCIKEMPDLQKLYEENSEEFVVLAVDVKEIKSTINDYLKDKDYTFPVLLDEDGSLATTYYVSSFPTTYVIDKEGYLLGGVPGMMTYPQMNQILQSVLEEK